MRARCGSCGSSRCALCCGLRCTNSIEGTYMVRAESDLKRILDVDRPGIQVTVARDSPTRWSLRPISVRSDGASQLHRFALAMSTQDNDPRPVPPVRPSPDDCCKSSCDPCVFDVYDAALERYE